MRNVRVAACLVGLSLVAAACSLNSGGAGPVSSASIQPVATGAVPLAPAFTSEDLAAPPGDNWPTYGGNDWNQRYSTLKQINDSNVSQLKPAWSIHLGSGSGSKYSGEATPLEYQGVIYTTTGADDVFAIDATTGKILWTYRPNLNDRIKTLCCAWNNRGVAIGDGKVYIAQLDGHLVALDQATGAVDWWTQLGRWEQGETLTMAPLYADGTVYCGLSGGEYGVRGRIYAIDAGTGAEKWRFYTVPGPGEPGNDTWGTGDAWSRGGAVVWNTPVIDPNLQTLYLSTSNTGPLFNGAARPGENLYSNSVIALNVSTGQMEWYYQEIHHDLWDYDATNPIILFDITIDGQLRHGLAQANKDGWVYLLDRTTGKPLLGIPEKPVPQDPSQATWPTQPWPKGQPFARQSITPTQAASYSHSQPIPWHYVNGGRVFTPPGDPAPVVKPGTLGGANWPPSSYNPSLGYMYVCGSDYPSLFPSSDQKFDPSGIQAGRQYLGSEFVSPAGAPLLGTFTAMDVRTNTIVWQKHYNTDGDNCYSGSVTTAGNLVFMGRNDGRVMAYAADTGRQLWSYRTAAGANAPPITFAVNGRQYVVQYSAGNALVGSTHGDILTAFALSSSASAGSSP